MKPRKIYRVNCIVSELADNKGKVMKMQKGHYIMPCFSNKKILKEFIKGTDLTYKEINL